LPLKICAAIVIMLIDATIGSALLLADASLRLLGRRIVFCDPIADFIEVKILDRLTLISILVVTCLVGKNR
jgi:hypothetical protein